MTKPAIPDVLSREPEAAADDSPVVSRFKRADLAAAAACAALGLLIAILPHLIWWSRTGEPTWASDYDEYGLYLPIVAQAYANHPTSLGDPSRSTEAKSMYPWVQFVPAVLGAKALGLGPTGASIIWRVWAGLSIGLAWFLVVRHFVGRPWVSAAIAAALLCDVGVFSGHILLKPIRFVYLTLVLPDGPTAALYPTHHQYRLITPGLSFAFLWLHVWLLARARDRPTRGRIVAAGVGFGLLFHVYFYFWTAATLGMGMAWLLDAGRRRVYFHAGWIGGLIGLPAVVAGWLLKRGSSEWLHRTDNFLPIARWSELLIPNIAIVVLPITFVVVLMRRRDLIHLWALSFAGLVLLNHQVVSGLQIQNFHWSYVWAPGLSLLVVLLAWGGLAARRANWPKPLAWALIALVVAEVGAGIWLRAFEATRTAETLEMMAAYRAYRAQRLAPGVAPLAPNAVLAGPPDFAAGAAILENQRPLAHYVGMYSQAIGPAEWAERLALDAALIGTTRSAFEADQRRGLTSGWGPWIGDRNPALRDEELALRLRLFDAILANPTDAVRRYGVRYIGLRAGVPPPAAVKTIGTQIQGGPTWDVWEVTAGRGESARE